MFAYRGNSEQDVRELLDALVQASKKDLRRKDQGSHNDGWGYVIKASNGLFYYRTEHMIPDNPVIPKLDGDIYAIFHTRKGSNPEGSKPSPIFSHPYMTATDNEIIFLAHNGALKGSRGRRIDSELVLESISKNGLENAIPIMKIETKSALNLLVMKIERSNSNTTINYLNYYTDKAASNYYDIYKKAMKGGKAVFSSSLMDYGINDGIKIGDEEPHLL